MQLHPPTIFLVLLVTNAMAAVLLLWAWSRNRAEACLLYGSGALGLVGAAVWLIAPRGEPAAWPWHDVAQACAIGAVALVWAAARRFNGERIHLPLLVAGPAVFMLLGILPGVSEGFLQSSMRAAPFIAGYCLAAAWSFFARDGLAARYAIAAALVAHALVVLLRTPFAWRTLTTGSENAPFGGVGFVFFAIETIVFLQVLTFLLVALTKERLEAQLRWTAMVDALSGLPNRRALFDRAEETLARNLRQGRPTAIAIFDLDRFKAVNDSYGHPTGDAMIRLFGDVARLNLRAGDHVGRIGGEEFAAVLPEATEEEARAAVERVVEAFARLSDERCPVRGTVSAGVAASSTSHDGLEHLLAAADQALYVAKRCGGNQVQTASANAGLTLRRPGGDTLHFAPPATSLALDRARAR